MTVVKLPSTCNETGYVYDANGNVVCFSSGGYAREISEALNRGVRKEPSALACCSECNQPFKPGEYLRGFLRSPDDETGSWTRPILVDEEFQDRVLRTKGHELTRVHTGCLDKEALCRP